MGLVFGGCARERKQRFDQALEARQCDMALENIPEYDENVKFLGRIDRAAQSTLSYAATGAGYVSDVVLTVVGGTVILVGLCAPTIALIALAESASVIDNSHDGYEHLGCLPMPKGVHPPRSGQKIYRATEDMRCPDLTALSKSVRRVTACYERTELPVDLQKTQVSLRSLTSNAEFMGCVSPAERAAVQVDLDRITAKAALL